MLATNASAYALTSAEFPGTHMLIIYTDRPVTEAVIEAAVTVAARAVFTGEVTIKWGNPLLGPSLDDEES
jgi:hypothetical protein